MSTLNQYDTPCPYCGFPVRISPQVNLGEMVTCPNCSTELEAVNLDPPELDYFWQDDWEGEEEFEEQDEYYVVEEGDPETPDWDDDERDDEADRDEAWIHA